jgi:ferric-dicitrate binding protein FerR (iron transport regulator)
MMKIDSQLIKRYLKGEAREGDKETISIWFSDLQAEALLRKEYKQIWDEIPEESDTGEYDGSMILNSIYHQIKLDESREASSVSFMKRAINIISRVAAILFIPLVMFLLIFKNEPFQGKEEIAYSEIYSPLGTRTQFYLPDGSTGWLNSDSYLEFPLSFRGRSREVMLRGEAYFDIASDPKKPFIVNGDNFEVVAHGTSFDVRAYPNDDIISVTLVQGNIDVSGIKDDQRRKISLTESGYMCFYNLKTMICKTSKVDVDKITSWKEGRLVFRDEPFEEVVKKINRWYNVNIVIKDKVLESYTYLATFEDETLDEVLKLLKLSAPIDYKDIGRKVREDGTFEKRVIELYYNP